MFFTDGEVNKLAEVVEYFVNLVFVMSGMEKKRRFAGIFLFPCSGELLIFK